MQRIDRINKAIREIQCAEHELAELKEMYKIDLFDMHNLVEHLSEINWLLVEIKRELVNGETYEMDKAK